MFLINQFPLDFNKTQLTFFLSKLLDHTQLTPITFTVTKNTQTHSHKTTKAFWNFFLLEVNRINQVENNSIQAHQRIFAFLDSSFSNFFFPQIAQHLPDTFFWLEKKLYIKFFYFPLYKFSFGQNENSLKLQLKFLEKTHSYIKGNSSFISKQMNLLINLLFLC
jgi:hypothetical protein